MSSWQSLFHLNPEQRHHHRIHLVGIGGTGLAPIAQVLREMGFQVSGSDQAPSPRTETLAAQQVRVGIGHDARHLFAPDAPRLPDLVLASSAIAGDNPEIKAAASEGIAVVKRKDLLGPLTAGRRVIAVAGTHGKTTTTGMIAHLLKHSGLQPGYIIGSDIRDLGIASAGRDSCFVIEADEYDDAFLGLRPEIIVLTNIDWDHPDYFPSAEAYEASFRRFASQLQPGGKVVFCQDDRRLRALASEHEDDTWVGYGTRAEASWKVKDVDISPGGTDFTLCRPPGDATNVHLAVPGFHNALNAAAALVAAGLAGIDAATAAPLLADFRGAGRRFEIKGEKAGVLVVDDYAHHPTEIRATLAAGRAAYPERELWAVYQPHTYSRTRTLLERFEGVFAPADHVLVLDIYAAREAFDPSITAAQVAAASRHQDAVTVGDLDQALAYLLAHVRTGSLVILLSAGSATELGPALLDALEDAGDRPVRSLPDSFLS